MPLLELPAALAKHGYTEMQLCHFHLPDRSPFYTAELRSALASAGVSLHAVLIDDGDVTHPENGERDKAWIASWIKTAESLGAAHARVIAGRQAPTPETMARSAAAFKSLAAGTSLRLETENWHELTSTPEAVVEFLDRTEGKVGLCADLGNWPRPRKYEDLPRIFSFAETCHAKLEFLTPTTLDMEDASACLSMAAAVGFDGAYVLVNGGPGDSEWDALAIQRDAIVNHR